jgi:hypothetical protein
LTKNFVAYQANVGNNIPGNDIPRKNIQVYWKNIPTLRMGNISGRNIQSTGRNIPTLHMGKKYSKVQAKISSVHLALFPIKP